MTKRVKKESKAAKIRTLLAEGVSVKDIAKKLKYAEPYVAQVKWHWQKKAKKTKAEKKQAVKVTKKLFDREYELYDVAAFKARDEAAMQRWYPFNENKPLPPADKDMVNSPDHYTHGGIETIDFIEAKDLGYHLGNVVKYVSRAPHKGRQIEDLKKARWYLDREIERLDIDKIAKEAGDFLF